MVMYTTTKTLNVLYFDKNMNIPEKDLPKSEKHTKSSKTMKNMPSDHSGSTIKEFINSCV